jgi:hypothetical protein
MEVRPATTSTVPGTTASICQRGGAVVESGSATATSSRPPGMPRMAPTSAGRICAAESPALTCWGVAPSARASADECLASSAVAQAMKIALTAARARRVQHGGSVVEVGVSREHGDDPADRNRGSSRGEQDAARSSSRDPQPKQQRDGQSRRERDQPGRSSGWAGRVGEREDGAGPGGADGGNEGRGDRHAQRDGRHQPDRGHGQRRGTGAADEAGTGIGERRSDQPSDRQPRRRREQGHHDVLGE